MSGALLNALGCGVLAAMFTWLAIVTLRDGSTPNWFNSDRHVERAVDPTQFWFWWFGWAALAGLSSFGSVKFVLLWWQTPVPVPASWGHWGGVIVSVLFLLLMVHGELTSSRLWRRGNPLRATTRARLRREATLRELIRNLADDPSTGWDDENLDQLLDSADFAYLDAIAAHLLEQPEPRRLVLAIVAVRDEQLPADPDDRAHLVELGIDPDAEPEPDDAEEKAPR